MGFGCRLTATSYALKGLAGPALMETKMEDDLPSNRVVLAILFSGFMTAMAVVASAVMLSGQKSSFSFASINCTEYEVDPNTPDDARRSYQSLRPISSAKFSDVPGVSYLMKETKNLHCSGAIR
jgi:hypothetical protein